MSEKEHLASSKEVSEEMSFATAVRRAVDDLFTCEAISQRFKETEDNEQLAEYVNHRQQVLVERLVVTDLHRVDSFAGPW